MRCVRQRPAELFHLTDLSLFFFAFFFVPGASSDTMANSASSNSLTSFLPSPTAQTTHLTTLAPLSADSSPSHHSSSGHSLISLPLVNGNGGTAAMMLERSASIMSPDSEEDTFHLSLSHHQPFKQEVPEGIENSYT